MHRRSIVVLAAALLAFAALQGFAADDYVIATVAGTGRSGFSGDGGPATEATFNFMVCDLYVDESGVLYVSDGGNNRIRKIDRSGTITTIAGNGSRGFSGDGGPATEASLNWPVGIDFDRAGNLYIADLYNHRIRKVDTSGIITTIAGTGTSGYSGDRGPATKAELVGPNAIRFDDAGNLYLSEDARPYFSRPVVRRIDTNGIITTVAGTGASGCRGDGGPAIAATMTGAQDLWCDQEGNLYLADASNNRIRRVETSGVITTVAGGGMGEDGGLATSASLLEPMGVWGDAEGNLFIADCLHNCIRKVDSAGIITTIAGLGKGWHSGEGGPAIEARFSLPSCVRVAPDGSIYFISGNTIRKLYRPR